MKYLISLLLSLLLNPIFCQKALNTTLKGSFNQFFSMEEKTRTQLSDTVTMIQYGTAGFKGQTAINLWVDEDSLLIKSEMQVERSILSDIQRVNSKDMIKSFIFEFCFDYNPILPLLERIHYIGRENETKALTDNMQLALFEVLSGERNTCTYEDDTQIIRFNNFKKDGNKDLFQMEFELK